MRLAGPSRGASAPVGWLGCTGLVLPHGILEHLLQSLSGPPGGGSVVGTGDRHSGRLSAFVRRPKGGCGSHLPGPMVQPCCWTCQAPLVGNWRDVVGGDGQQPLLKALIWDVLPGLKGFLDGGSKRSIHRAQDL